MKTRFLATSFLVFSVATLVYGDLPSNTPPGQEKSKKTEALEVGAVLLQSDAPPDGLDIHLVGLHPMKDDPSHQMDVHHFCRQVNEDFSQCALFDNSTADANLIGIEYIISGSLFETLPEQEKQYWHPHNYEILSGILVAPNLPEAAERELMRTKINSYGKTWHLWNSGISTTPTDKLPLGEAMLAWSFNHDGEVNPELLKRREKLLGISTQTIKKSRKELQKMAKPQAGTEPLKTSKHH